MHVLEQNDTAGQNRAVGDQVNIAPPPEKNRLVYSQTAGISQRFSNKKTI